MSAEKSIRQPLDLEQALNVAKLVEFEQQFVKISAKEGSSGLGIEDFRTAVRAVIDGDVTDEEADSVFFKVNVNYEMTMRWQVSFV